MRASIDRSKASTKPTALDEMTGVDSMLHSYGMLGLCSKSLKGPCQCRNKTPAFLAVLTTAATARCREAGSSFLLASTKNCPTIEYGRRTGGRLLESTAKE